MDSTDFDFYIRSVTAAGIALNSLQSRHQSRLHRPRTRYRSIQRSNLTTSRMPVIMPADPDLNIAFFASSTGEVGTVQSFNLTTRALIGTIPVPNVTGNPTPIIRWGQNGLIGLHIDDGRLYLLGGNFIHKLNFVGSSFRVLWVAAKTATVPVAEEGLCFCSKRVLTVTPAHCSAPTSRPQSPRPSLPRYPHSASHRSECPPALLSASASRSAPVR